MTKQETIRQILREYAKWNFEIADGEHGDNARALVSEEQVFIKRIIEVVETSEA